MKRLGLTTLLLLTFGLALIGTVAWPHTGQAQGFSLTQGIVGNLGSECRLKGNCDWCDFIQLMVILQKVILSLFGGLALIMLIWGGQSIITASGNQEKIAAGKKLITSTLLGVVIILAGFFIIYAIVGILTSPYGSSFNTKIFSADWWTAQCISNKPTDPNFCRFQPDGTACGNIPGGVQVCIGGSCSSTPSCAYMNQTSGPGISCQANPCSGTQREITAYCPSGQYCCGQ